MKHRREGTLEEWQFSSDDGDDMGEAFRVAARMGISGMDDFIQKAREIVREMGDSGPLRAKRAQKLAGDLDRLEAALAAGVDRSVLYNAIGAGLTYANLANEKKFELQTRAGFTRSEYFEAKNATRTRAELAEQLGVSDQALRKWERKHLK